MMLGNEHLGFGGARLARGPWLAGSQPFHLLDVELYGSLGRLNGHHTS
jgi:hypothetical protein